MKIKDYKGIEDYIEKKREERRKREEKFIKTKIKFINNSVKEKKKDLLKGTVICKAKKCNKYLYKNQSTSNPEYCMECL